MIGRRSNKPASKPTVLISGALMTAGGVFFLMAMIFGERAPGAPLWAIVVAYGNALGVCLVGVHLLRHGLRMP